MKFRVFWGVAPCSLVGADEVHTASIIRVMIIALMLEVVHTIEMLACSETASEDSKLHTNTSVLEEHSASILVLKLTVTPCGIVS
jgi:glutamate synthase domain-containing protein 2